jgi:hypothetical protein
MLATRSYLEGFNVEEDGGHIPEKDACTAGEVGAQMLSGG